MEKINKNRIEVGAELFCYDGKSLVEKVTVESVNRKEVTATLSNQVTISRYPDKDGYFSKLPNNGAYIICKWDEETERFYKSKIARSRVLHFVSEIQVGLLNRTSNLMKASDEDIEKLLKLNKVLTKILEK